MRAYLLVSLQAPVFAASDPVYEPDEPDEPVAPHANRDTGSPTAARQHPA